MAARGRQPNLSFFAFTATPKARTLELFGAARPRTDRYAPFHLYSMRQAIEEGFILDVLANYTTYDDLLAGREGDRATTPSTTRAKAQARDRPVRARCTRTTSRRRPRSSSSTSASTPRTKIGGKARRWSSPRRRLHAVRYKQAIDSYIREQGLRRHARARRVLRAR